MYSREQLLLLLLLAHAVRRAGPGLRDEGAGRAARVAEEGRPSQCGDPGLLPRCSRSGLLYSRSRSLYSRSGLLYSRGGSLYSRSGLHDCGAPWYRDRHPLAGGGQARGLLRR